MSTEVESLEIPKEIVANSDGILAVAINYEHVYQLLGQLLTLNDAVNGDSRQRKAQKDLTKHLVYSWVDSIYAEQHPDFAQSSPSNHRLPAGSYDPVKDQE
jgi:hypothetical protein